MFHSDILVANRCHSTVQSIYYFFQTCQLVQSSQKVVSWSQDHQAQCFCSKWAMLLPGQENNDDTRNLFLHWTSNSTVQSGVEVKQKWAIHTSCVPQQKCLRRNSEDVINVASASLGLKMAHTISVKGLTKPSWKMGTEILCCDNYFLHSHHFLHCLTCLEAMRIMETHALISWTIPVHFQYSATLTCRYMCKE